MKKSYSFFNIIVALLLICAVTIEAQTKVSKWGSTPRGNNWPILNTASTPAGNASMGASAAPTAWASILGGFDNTLQATTSQAVVVTGTFEFVGGGAGSAYTWLRYALTYQDNSTLTNQNTTTAAWAAANHSGYAFNPRSGTGTIANGPYGQATLLTIPNAGGWNSSYAGGTSLGVVLNQPERAVATAGVYDWAMSVQPLASGGTEVRWYFVKQAAAGQQTTYWFAGSVVDPNSTSTKFNAVAFSVNSDVDATCKQVNLGNVTAGLGAPITIPTAPWQAYYIDQWGLQGNRTGGTTAGKASWKLVPDPAGLIGNCGIAGAKVPTAWATIRGGFDNPVTATTSKAIIVTGVIEFVGSGPITWSGLRYGLFRQDAAGTVQYAKTDSARWGTITNGVFAWGTEASYGYMFTPQSQTTYVGNIPSGTNASQGINTGGSWVSTFGGAVGFGGVIQQAPARAKFDAGKYNFAISVQPKADGTNEVRFYLIKQPAAGKKTTFWYGGTLIDPLGTTKTFNGICFGLNPNYDQTTSPITAMHLTDVKVDLGAPITVPKAPWEAYYVDSWGFYGGRIANWKYTVGEFVGNATVSGTSALPADQWVAVRGAFVQPVSGINKDTALVVTGKMEFIGGGFEAPNSLLLGLNYTESAGKIVATKVDSTRWDGTDARNSGYLFIPPSGKNAPLDWAIGTSYKTGNFGAISNKPWAMINGDDNYVLGNISQKPANAVAGAGVYDFLISVAPQTDGSNEVKFKVNNANNSYVWSGRLMDTHNPLATQKFNGLTFAYGGGSKSTTLKIMDVKLDLVNPGTIPVSVGSEGRTSSLPTEYTLNQNYPNPFNPETTIEFALPQNESVRLVVYDILGRVVTELINGNMTAGYHKINFNASNLSTGIYFYSIKAGDFSSVKKLVLLK